MGQFVRKGKAMGNRIVQVRKWIVLDALLLLALSGYEFVSRVDAMWGPLKMFVNMAVGEGISFERAAAYVDVRVFEVPGFMLLCILLSLIAMATVRTRRGSFVLLPCSLALGVWGLFVQMSLLGEMIRYAKVLPLFLMSVLYFALILLQRAHRKALRNQARRAGYTTGYMPIQPQHMEGRRFKHGIGDHHDYLPRRKRVS